MLKHLLVKGSIEVNNFVNSPESKKLLDKNLYLGNDFNKLNDVFNLIKNSIRKTQENSNVDFIKMLFSKEVNQDSTIQDITTKDINTKDITKDININGEITNILNFCYEKLNYQQLTQIFADMDDETFDKSQKVYNYYCEAFFGYKQKMLIFIC